MNISMTNVRWFENVLKVSTVEEVELEQLKHLLEAEGDAGFELEPGQDEVGNRRWFPWRRGD